jgi:hypothetical protein
MEKPSFISKLENAPNIDTPSISSETGLPTTENTPTTKPSFISRLEAAENIQNLPTSGPGTYFGGTENLSKTYADPLSKYLDYNVPITRGFDWNEIRARNQGVMEKLGRGFIKMGATAAGAVAENTIGLFTGIGSAVTGGSFSNDPLGRSVDEMNEWLSKNLPHYYTKAEMDPNRSVLESLGTANFWTDKFANGLGYALGSIATMWATGGVGLLGRSAGAIGRGIAAAGQATKAGRVISAGEQLKNIYAASKMIKSGAALTTDLASYGNLARGLNAAKYLEMGAMMSIGEAKVEAREKSSSYVSERFSDWEEANEGKSAETDMPDELKNAILDEARSVENFTFAANLAVLTPGNLFTFGKMLKGKSVGGDLTYKLTKEGDKVVQAMPKSGFGKAFARANEFAKPIYKSQIEEAFQEGAQYMIGEAGIDYYKNKFSTGTEDLLSSFGKGLENTFGSADGRESMLLGFLIGGTTAGYSSAFGADKQERANKLANTNRVMDIYNSGVFKDLVANISQKEEGLRLAKAMEAANDMGNYKLAEEIRLNLVASHAIKMANLDSLDLAFEQLDDLAALPEEEFKKAAGFALDKSVKDQTKGKSQFEVVEDLKKEMTELVEYQKNIDEIIKLNEPTISPIGKLFESKEDKAKRTANALYDQKLKSTLLSNLIGIKHRDGQIDEDINTLRDLAGDSKTMMEAFAGFDKNKLFTLLKRNEVIMDENGNIKFPDKFVETDVVMNPESESNDKKIDPDKTIKNNISKEDLKSLSSLAQMLQEAESFDPIKKQKFATALTSLFRNIDARESAITSFNELVSNPQYREFKIAEKIADEEKAKTERANKEADITLDNARTTAELDAFLASNMDNLSDDMQERVKARYKELVDLENEYIRSYDEFDDENLEDMMQNIDEIYDQDPARAFALNIIYNARKNKTSVYEEVKKSRKFYQGQEEDTETTESDVESSINDLFNQSQTAQDEQGSKYTNKFDISADGTTIRINGVIYKNLKHDLKEVIKLDDTESKVIAVTLTNEKGVDVTFKVEEDEVLVQELADLLTTIAASVNTANTVGKSAEEIEINILEKFKVLQTEIENIFEKYTETIDKMSDGQINNIIKDITYVEESLVKMANNWKQLTIREGLDIKDLENRQEYKDLINLLDNILKPSKAEFVKELAKRNNTSTSVNSNEVVVNPITDVEENDYKATIADLEEKISAVNAKIIKAQTEIEDLEDLKNSYFQAYPDTDTSNITENIEDLKKDIDVFGVELEILQDRLKTVQEDYENRKSSQTSTDVSDSQGTEEANQKQGDTGEDTTKPTVSQTEEPVIDVDAIAAQLESGELEDASGFGYTEQVDEDQDDVISDISNINANLEIPEEDEVILEGETEKIVPLEESAMDIQLISSEYQLTEDYSGIIVDDNGNPLPNSIYKGVKADPSKGIEAKPGVEQIGGDGKVIGVNQELLNSGAFNVGSKIIFEVRDDTKWFKTIKDDPAIPASEYWKNVPIYVLVEDNAGNWQRVGMLEKYNPTKLGSTKIGSTRERIYRLAATGQRPGSTLGNILVNYSNAETTEGDTYFYNPLMNNTEDTPFRPGIAILKLVKGLGIWKTATPGNSLTIDEVSDLSYIGQSKQVKTSLERELGTVGFLFRHPNGSVGLVKGFTKKMTPVGIKAVLENIKNDKADLNTDIVGFNIAKESGIFNENRGLVFSRNLGKGDVTKTNYVFWLAEAESYVSVDAEQLKSLLKNPKSKIIFGFVEITPTEKGATDFTKNLNFKPTDTEKYQEFVLEGFVNALENKRYEVNQTRLFEDVNRTSPYISPINGKEYASYYNFITDPNAIPDINNLGHTGILSMDTPLTVLNSPYSNSNIAFGPLTANGKEVEGTNNISRVASKLEINTDHSKTNEEEQTELPTSVDLDDLNSHHADNSLFDDDELTENKATIEEETTIIVDELEEDETTGSTTDLNDLLYGNLNISQDEGFTRENPIIDVKEEDISTENPTTRKLLDILKNIETSEFSGMYTNPKTGQETHYTINGKNFERVTSKIYPNFTETESSKAKAVAGTEIHKIAENIFNNAKYRRPTTMRPIAFLQLKTQIDNIKKHIAKKQQTIIATENIIYNEFKQIAGRFDILVQNKSGSYTLYDIKTGSEKGLKDYDKPYKDLKTGQVLSPSKRQMHGTQLSIYAYMLRGHAFKAGLDIKIERGNVLYLPIELNDKNELKYVGDLNVKSFQLEKDLDKLIKGKFTFEQKEDTTTSDPAVKNAGKSKSSTTAKGKKAEYKDSSNAEETDSKKPKSSKSKSYKSFKDAMSNVEGTTIFKGSDPENDEEKFGTLIHMVIESRGGFDTETFKENVKDTIGLKLTDEQAEELQDKILEKYCKGE